MAYRKDLLSKEETYHIFTKSIAGYQIFNTNKDFERMLGILSYYNAVKPFLKYSLFLKLQSEGKLKDSHIQNSANKLVKIIAYCLMPTHIHLVVQQLTDNGISKFVNLVLMSYSKYFNLKHNRKGPLWEGRFKNVRVATDEQLIHLTRYVHLNPVTAYLVNKPDKWEYSSYKEYTGTREENKKMCDFSGLLSINARSYQKFVDDQIDYQRELANIKNLVLE